MAGEPSPSSSLPWTSVIDALVNCKEVDVITLINVFKKSPKISSEVESKARELISLKILEQLFDRDIRSVKSARCAHNSGVSFDYSKSCEDVLEHIFGKMNDPNIWDESEKSKWNVKSFIAYKKRLYDSLVEGKSSSYLTSFKQMVTSRKMKQDGTKMYQNTSNEGNRNTKMEDLESKDGDKICQDAYNEGNRSKRMRTSNIQDADIADHSCKSQSLKNDECYQKELYDIDAKKQAFFSSNCKNKERFTHLKDANCCMKCTKGGQLLICSSNGCSFVFHESCLVSSTPFNNDSSGKFYCPFCKCSRSISEYWVAKKKSSLVRNHLAFFSKVDNKNTESQIPIVSDPDLLNEMTEISDKDGCKERADVVDRSSKFQKSNKSFTGLLFDQRRRVPVPWTQSEEETLKKYMEMFKSCNNIQEIGFPWSKILKLGASTFQKSRIPVDLKDKWRNMQKASKKTT